jgi:hypothetical protein
MTMAWRSAGPPLVTKDPPVTGGSSATTNAAAIARSDDASKQGVSQKLARISIKSVNKEDVVTALVSAWNVPS